MEIRISPETLRGARLFVGCPMYDGRCHGEFTFALCQLSALASELGLALELFFASGEALVMKARNAIVDRFLRSDATHLMLIDSDIGFAARDVLALLALALADAGHNHYDVLSAPYPIKRMAWARIAQAARAMPAGADPEWLARIAGDPLFHPAQPGAFELGRPVAVTQAGTGFMLIRRATFDAFRAAYPHRRYLSDGRGIEAGAGRFISQFFDTAITGSETLADDLAAFLTANPAADRAAIERYLAERPGEPGAYVSEDIHFCRLVGAIGLGLWSCPWMELSHIGSHGFAGHFAALAGLAADPRP
ncbi:MAG: hypothetical protein KGK11_01055 [Sphingomonadales bacterium]|nr:hypothetical protein [Sphingomonadales bacterium]